MARSLDGCWSADPGASAVGEVECSAGCSPATVDGCSCWCADAGDPWESEPGASGEVMDGWLDEVSWSGRELDEISGFVST
jgi:hypothetical protein